MITPSFQTANLKELTSKRGCQLRELIHTDYLAILVVQTVVCHASDITVAFWLAAAIRNPDYSAVVVETNIWVFKLQIIIIFQKV
jgi:hypothetical protein